MSGKLLSCCVLALSFAASALAFEVDEFKSGMGRDKVKEILRSWSFDKVQDFSQDTLIAYDLGSKGTNRQFVFNFCNDKLVGLEQEIKPSLKSFVATVNSFNAKYGQPSKVEAENGVISSGEKHTLALFWRKGIDIVGLRMVLLPANDQILLTYQTPNACWQVPR